MTVIAIWAVFAATAMPVANRLVAQHRLSAASHQLGFAIAGVRMQAVGQNVFVRLVLVGDASYARERSVDGLTYVRDGAPIRLPAGVTVTAGTMGLPRFDRQGLAPTSTALTIASTAGTRTIYTNMLGRVTTS